MRKIFESFLFLSILLVCACSDPTGIGESLLPDDNLFDVSDTVLNVKLTTIREDSIRTDSLGNYVLGYLKDDPDFGTTKASIFTQVGLSFNNINFDNSVVYDSLVLHLDYSFSYGDTLARQTIKVHTLYDSLHRSENHYMYDEFHYYPKPIGSLLNHQHNINKTDTITRPLLTGEDTVNNQILPFMPQLSIRLDDYLGESFYQEIIENDDTLDQNSPFDNNTQFLQYFRGFYITVDETASDDNLMISYNLASSNSRLALYYHTETKSYIYGDTINGVVDSTELTNYSYPTQPLNFVISNSLESINQITNNYNGTKAMEAIGNSNSDIAYSIGMGGLNIGVEIEGIDDDFFNNIAIHKATLQLKEAEPNNFERYFVPPILFASSLNENGNFLPIEDYAVQVLTNSFYETGGFVTREDSISNNTYLINCSTFIQNYVEGEISGPLVLTPSANWLNVLSTQVFTVPLNSRYFIPSRVKLANGGSESDTKLVLKYSKITN